MKLYAAISLLILCPTLAWAQANGTAIPRNNTAFGGPSGVSGEQQINEDILNAFRVDNRTVHLQPWYNWKAKVSERSGFSFGVNAQIVYGGVSDALDGQEDSGASGIYRVQGEWSLLGRDTGHPGSVLFRVENRSKIGSGIAPGSLRGSIGAVATTPVFAYSDNFGTDFSVLAWQQLFADKKAGIAVGLLDFSAYLDAMYYQTISRGFLNQSFILNPTLATTGIGALGAAAKGMLGDNFWIGGGVYDAKAKSGDPSFDTWDSSELLTHVEVGWTPEYSRRSTDRVQLTYWQKDRLVEKGTPKGSGWLASYSWKVASRYVPFVRAGWSDGGGGAIAKRSVTAGFSYQMAFQDSLTVGLGWNKPSDKTYGEELNSEKVLEASYIWQITANTSILPDVQLIMDPAKNPNSRIAWFAGLRVRITL